ncbi:MAG TPA: HTTM domain-containing protein [Chryseolinea sp.]|nr:HTTM domain-containing protein [Chryseolinea sp.]
MVKQRTNVLTIVDYWVRDFNNPATVRLFFRALLLLTFVKIVILWPFSHNVMIHHNITLPASWIGKLVFAPSFLANVNVDIFYGVSLVFLIIAFLLRPNYLTTGLFFWLTFNLYIVNLPFANGADLVLFMLAFWCIPLASTPTFKSETLTIVQKALYNSGITFLQLQIVFIYLVSGWDKLNSETWRSGEAIDYITHLSNLFNPAFVGMIDDPSVQLILSWITIIFELSFVILIWFDKTRIPVLAIGVLFHLFIWIVMTLPDFATVMIISYIIFLKDSDYQRLPPRLRQLLL